MSLSFKIILLPVVSTHLKGEFGIVLGKDMADSLGLRLNDSVTLVLPEATPSPAGVVPRFKRFKVVGIFSVGAEVDSMVGYIALYDASTLLRLPDGAQGVRLKLDDILPLLKLPMTL